LCFQDGGLFLLTDAVSVISLIAVNLIL